MSKKMSPIVMRDTRMENCPFCGGIPMIRKRVSYGKNTKEKIPEGAKIIKGSKYVLKSSPDGERYEYQVFKYIPYCPTTLCPCNMNHTAYDSIDEAVRRWNQRV